MPFIDKDGYMKINRKTNDSRYKSIWLIKPSRNKSGVASFKNCYFPSEWIGKRVRFKVEIAEV